MRIRVTVEEISRITIDKKNYPMRIAELVKFSRSQREFIAKFAEFCKFLKGIYIMQYSDFNDIDKKGRNILNYLEDILKIPDAMAIFSSVFFPVIRFEISQKAKFVNNVISKRCDNLLFQNSGNYHFLSDVFNFLRKFDLSVCLNSILNIMCETLNKFRILNELGFDHRMIDVESILYDGKQIKISEYHNIYFVGCKESNNFSKVMRIFESELASRGYVSETLFKCTNYRQMLNYFGKNLAEISLKTAFYENYKDEFIEEMEYSKKSDNVNENFALNIYGAEGYKIRVLYENINVEKIPDYLNFFPMEEMLEILEIKNLYEFKVSERSKFSRIFF